MSVYPIERAARRRRVRRLAVLSIAAAGLAVGAITAYAANAAAKVSGGVRYAYGPAQSLGNGTARVYVTLDVAGRPTSLGVALTEAALDNLPKTPMPGMPSAKMLMLQLPEQARVTGFDHVMLDWNPMGHEPEHVYTLPHFDFHFFTVSEAEQRQVMPTNPKFAEQASKLPDARYVPQGYIAAHVPMKVSPAEATVPMMGLHWIAAAAPELRGETFTKTFLYGSYDGKFTFYEPMITKAHIESAKAAPGNAIVAPVTLPSTFYKEGYYPTRYSITWNAAAKEYRISLDALVKRG